LGKGKVTDFLTISFSSTDYVGHQFGPNSIEVEDTYLRLDKDLAELLTFLDTYIGKQNVLVFLTADHGAALVPDYLTSQKIPAGVFDGKPVIDSLKHYLNAEYGNGEWVKFYTNQQVYFNHDLIISKRVNKEEMEDKAANFLIAFKGVANVITATTLQKTEFTKSIENKIENGYYRKRSGDIIITLEPAWFEGHDKGTTHGEAYGYDTHVPLLWYGGMIKEGSTINPINITDIAPTIAQLLDIESPNGCVGVPIAEVIK
jgi:predicted AlkP superfamily pyrophosphatase or phosphodiesterase